MISIATDISTREKELAELRLYCRHVFLASHQRTSRILQLPQVVGRFMRGEPFTAKYSESKHLGELLYRVTGEEAYDIIQFELSETANNLRFVNRRHNAKILLSMHDIISLQTYRRFKREKSIYKQVKLFLTWFPMLSWEPRIARLFDRVIVVSNIDKILLQVLEPMLDVSVVPNGVDTKAYRPYPLDKRERNILIVGALYYDANAEAAMHFYNEIFPIVRRTIPDCTLTIVGKDPPVELQRLNRDPRIMIKGNVGDVRPYYASALVSAVALKAGGGTRLKILESMALGTPVVSTRLGCEGIEVKNGQHILVADEPGDFAGRICDLMTSASLWQEISKNARDLVEEKYCWDHICDDLEAIYNDLARIS